MPLRASTTSNKSWTYDEETTLAILSCYDAYPVSDYPDLLYTLWGRVISADEIQAKLDKRNARRDSGGIWQEASPLWTRVLALGAENEEVLEKLEHVERVYRNRKGTLAWLEGEGCPEEDERTKSARRQSRVDWTYLAW
ncbi:hypothetical protein W97_07309 [Coniosporium apollinis CBS 100218]|uniref:Uncharacterized protein n=1 Tax=Coniosporium apollinis (strain CBS 100218) TaxID=1168221 RepID=R7Z1V1_CONA1|nr:uncharacterized protein W97_07309 [Coniosporium apollinis CBS 100218]EON68160.1 hypothetical protein W97_07309 [Coniosporium apollinis CBS 100218]